MTEPVRLGDTDAVKALMFTPKDKLACAARELALRRANYPKWVARGTMKPAVAERELAVMEAIVADLRQVVARAAAQAVPGRTDPLAAALRDMANAMENPAFAQLAAIAADRIDETTPDGGRHGKET